MINILNANLTFKDMTSRNIQNIDTLFLHHTSTENETVEQVHQSHLNNGWSGIGYNWYVRKNGEVWQGRDINFVPAGVLDHNANSVHICFEGNFEIDTMTNEQIQAGFNIIDYVKKLLPNIKTVLGHKEVMATDCPGKNFPLDTFKNFSPNPIKNGWLQWNDGRWSYYTNDYALCNVWVKDTKGYLYLDNDGKNIINGIAKDKTGNAEIKDSYFTGQYK